MVLAILGVAGYYWASQNAKLAGGPVISVPTVAADSGTVVATIRVNGTIAAKNQATILAPRLSGSRTDVNRGGAIGASGGGRGFGGGGGGGNAGVLMGGGGGPQNDFSLILMKLKDPGARVKKGDTVAEFDPQMQIQRLDDYKDTQIQTQATIKSSLASMASQRESHTQQVRQARASLDSALEDQKKGPVLADIDKQLADLAVEQAQANYKQLLFEDDLVDQEQQSKIRSTALNLSQSQLELARTEANVGKMVLKATMDGIVVLASTVRNNELGQLREGDEVRAGSPVLYIVDPNSMVLMASVNQVDTEKLRMGMKAKIRLDAYADIEVPGTLEGIGAMSKTSTFRAGYVGEIPVRVRLDKMDSRIIPDLTASAEVFLSTEENTLVLPRSAVFDENGGKYVFLQSPEGWLRKPVETGVASYTEIAVHTGLKKGDVVALQRPM
jgi:multidrug efflux pump subunit AcrA (membrane-fusion protein)